MRMLTDVLDECRNENAALREQIATMTRELAEARADSESLRKMLLFSDMAKADDRKHMLAERDALTEELEEARQEAASLNADMDLRRRYETLLGRGICEPEGKFFDRLLFIKTQRDALTAALTAKVAELMGTPDDYADDGEPMYLLRASKLRALAALSDTGKD